MKYLVKVKLRGKALEGKELNVFLQRFWRQIGPFSLEVYLRPCRMETRGQV